jgi:hypothetical protein
MHIARGEFGPEILDRITETVRERVELTRYALAKLVCGWVGLDGCDGLSQGVELQGLAGEAGAARHD